MAELIGAPAEDIVRLASRENVDLLLMDGRRPLLGEGLEEAAPSGVSLVVAVAARVVFRRQPHERAQLALDPARLGRVGDEIGDRLDERLVLALRVDADDVRRLVREGFLRVSGT